MNLRKKWNKWKNAKWMWDVSRVNVMIDNNDNSWIALRDYEYLAKYYKEIYFMLVLVIVGLSIVGISMLW